MIVLCVRPRTAGKMKNKKLLRGSYIFPLNIFQAIEYSYNTYNSSTGGNFKQQAKMGFLNTGIPTSLNSWRNSILKGMNEWYCSCDGREGKLD